jgi:DNA-binding CsgD family transcriptional regulator
MQFGTGTSGQSDGNADLLPSRVGVEEHKRVLHGRPAVHSRATVDPYNAGLFLAKFPSAARQLEHSLERIRSALDEAGLELRHALADCTRISNLLRQTGQRVQTERPVGRLTSQEYRVALLAASGASDGQIAAATNLSVHTVKTHMKSALRKLAIRSRWQLIEFVTPSQSEMQHDSEESTS